MNDACNDQNPASSDICSDISAPASTPLPCTSSSGHPSQGRKRPGTDLDGDALLDHKIRKLAPVLYDTAFSKLSTANDISLRFGYHLESATLTGNGTDITLFAEPRSFAAEHGAYVPKISCDEVSELQPEEYNPEFWTPPDVAMAELAHSQPFSHDFSMDDPFMGLQISSFSSDDTIAGYQAEDNPSLFELSQPVVLQEGPYNNFQVVGLDSSPSGFLNGLGHPEKICVDRTSSLSANDPDSRGGPPWTTINHEKRAENEQAIQDLLQDIRPDEHTLGDNQFETPEGLYCSLHPHQQLALRWMIKMEEGTNKGGILADDMGLGKTISTLALLLERPPSDEVKTNLIVCPVSLMTQWENEIYTKIEPRHGLSVFLYYGKGKDIHWSTLRTYDVVLTTYGTLVQQYKSWKSQTPGADSAADADLVKKHTLIHPESEFHRVILDEAQNIKNKKSFSAEAACAVKARFRWCLTGTPMMNGVDELYPLLQFLKIGPYDEFSQFDATFGSLSKRKKPSDQNRDAAMQKLRDLLKAIMLRRMKNSEIEGKPVLNLPPKTEEVIRVVFSEEERSFYRGLEANFQTQYSKHLHAGTVGKNYHYILVLLQRLRQACCHPYLVLDVHCVANTELTVEDMVRMAQDLSPEVIDNLKKVEAFTCPICFNAVPNPSLIIPCGHDVCYDCLVTLLERSAETQLQAKCHSCDALIQVDRIINYSTFKRVHMSTTFDDSEEAEESVMKDSQRAGEVENDDRCNSHKGKGTSKEGMLTLRLEARKARRNKDARRRCCDYLRRNWRTSSKLTACSELLKKIRKTGEKTIVFSQFTMLLDLLEILLKDELRLDYARYDGSMSQHDRDVAAVNFQDPTSRATVFLMSLKAGNAGLNLTAASHVIIMDPFWNPYTEMQAVGRAHRIGQKETVKVHRILVSETIEDRITALQMEKQALVGAAHAEGESRDLGGLTQRNLAYLLM